MELKDVILGYKYQSEDPLNIIFLVDNILVLVDYNGGPGLTMYVLKRQLRNLAEGFPAERMESEPGHYRGFCMIGMVCPNEENFTSKVETRKLQEFISKADKRFMGLLASHGDKTESFGDFLSRTMEYKDYDKDMANVLGLSYYWLIGERKQNKSFLPLEIFEKKQGILVDPETGKLPIYSNAMFAQMAAYEYKRRYGYELEFFEIPCLGCFLSGLGQSAGKKVRDITYLDSKWKILYHTDNQDGYKIPNHFVIHDEHNDDRFLLCGCMDHGRKPVWLEINNAKGRGILANDIFLCS